MPSKFTATQAIEAIRATSGNLTVAAKNLSVARKTMYAFMRRHPSVAEALAEARETMLDNAESALYRQVLEGNTVAMIFFLKTQGKSRGYVERAQVEHSGPDGSALVIQIERRKDD